MTSRARRRFAFAAILLLFLVVLAEIVSYVAIALAPAWLGQYVWRTPAIFAHQTRGLERARTERPEAVSRFDARIGWRMKPNSRGPIDTINGLGVRSLREYAPTPPQGAIRVAAFGDSVVYGTEVPDAETWTARMEAQASDFEVLNYGVPAYGNDQAYLLFQEVGFEAAPHVVLMGVSWITLKALVDVSATFRTDLMGPTSELLVKPRFRLGDDGDLVFVPNPIGQSGALERYLAEPRRMLENAPNSFWYEPAIFENPLYDWSATVRLASNMYAKLRRRFLASDRPMTGMPGASRMNEQSSAFRILERLLDRFVDETRAHGALPLILVFEDDESMARLRAGRPGAMTPLTEHLRERGVDFVDVADALGVGADAPPLERLYEPSGHYSPEGNDRIAAFLLREIRGRLGEGGP